MFHFINYKYTGVVLILTLYVQSGLGQVHHRKINYDVTHYNFDLILSDTTSFIKGSCVVFLKNTSEDIPYILLDLGNNLSVDSVSVLGTKTEFSHFNDTLEIFNTAYRYNNVITVKVFYQGYGEFLNKYGLVNKTTDYQEQKITYSFCEPFYSKHWFPVNQDLEDKADSVTMSITVDNYLKAISNGTLVNKINLPDNKIKYTWKTKHKIAYYLISVAVSDYLEYKSNIIIENDTLPFVNYLYNSTTYLYENKDIIDTTADIIRLYSILFGKYPFIDEKYGHVVAPIGGGMEHLTIATMAWFDFELIAHELAHQWWGDFVTCSTWNDIWINEGFAQYSVYLAYEFLKSKDIADNWLLKENLTVLSENEGSVYISANSDSVPRIFSMRLTYKKGAAILHMLRQVINDDDKFFDILRTFLKEYANKNASGDDFKEVCERITNFDLTDFFNSWYYGEGFPLINISCIQKDNRLIITAIKDKNYILSMKYKFIFFNSDDIIDEKINNQYIQTDTFFVKGKIKNVIPNPLSDQLFLVANLDIKHEYAISKDISFNNDNLNNIIEILFWESAPHTIKIYDIQGHLYLNELIKDNYFIISTTDYANGMFIIEIINKNKKIVRKKFIKY